MEELAQVYSKSLFEVAQARDELDAVKDELGTFAGALDEDRDLAVFFFSPYFSTSEKKDGLGKLISGATETFSNFLDLLIEKHRMPVIFRIRDAYNRLWEAENKLLPVEITSAVKLDEDTVRQIGDRIGKETGERVELTTRVDPAIVGGLVLRVGNLIMDASIRHRLEQLRKEVAKAA